ncbi:hypothetical protein QYF36_014103 [Acer negundo]|nr:hypothetical protein QYF36_014103 [Acer negundo]
MQDKQWLEQQLYTVVSKTYVRFQFYAYDKGTTVSQILKFFDNQSSNYRGSNLRVSFGIDGSGGLSPENGSFEACKKLKVKANFKEYLSDLCKNPVARFSAGLVDETIIFKYSLVVRNFGIEDKKNQRLEDRIY